MGSNDAEIPRSWWARVTEVSAWIPSRWPLVSVAIMAVLSGLLEAVVMTLIASAAGALAAGDTEVSIDIASIDIDGSVRAVLAIGLAASVGMVIARLIGGHALSRLGSATLTATRHRLLDDYLAAPYEEQRRSVQAELHELIVVKALRLTQIVMLFTTALAALFTFVALLFVAILLAPVIASALVLTSIVLAVVFLPLLRRTFKAGAVHMKSQVDVGVVVGDVAGLLAETHVYDARPGLLARADRSIVEGGHSFGTASMANQIGQAGYVGAVFVLLLLGLAAVDVWSIGDPTTLGAVVLLMLRGLRQTQTMQSSVQSGAELYPNVTAIVELTDRFHRHRDRTGTRPLTQIETIVFEGVDYHYEDSTDGVSDVSVALHRGELVGVVGPSGSGKSTFAELVMGLRAPTSGSLTVNGVDRAEFDRHGWFARVAYVGQDPRLLDGTVADNIAFFRDVAGGEIDDVVARAALADDISRWVERVDRPVGIGGQDLSGGQRQRIAIARALIGHPDLVVFDEPTSALDTDSELVVRQTIAEMGSDTLVLLISHRPSTLALCERILAFDDGRVRQVSVEELPRFIDPDTSARPAGS